MELLPSTVLGLMLKSIFFWVEPEMEDFSLNIAIYTFEGGICEQTDKITDLILIHPPIIIIII